GGGGQGENNNESGAVRRRTQGAARGRWEGAGGDVRERGTDARDGGRPSGSGGRGGDLTADAAVCVGDGVGCGNGGATYGGAVVLRRTGTEEDGRMPLRAARCLLHRGVVRRGAGGRGGHILVPIRQPDADRHRLDDLERGGAH